MFKANPLFGNIARLLQIIMIIGACRFLIPRIMPHANELSWIGAAIIATCVCNLLLDGLLWKTGKRFIRILPVLVWLWSAVLIGITMIVRLVMLSEEPMLSALFHAFIASDALKGESGPYILIMSGILGFASIFIMMREETPWTYPDLMGYPIIILVVLILPCIIYVPAIIHGFASFIPSKWQFVVFAGITTALILVGLMLAKKEAQHVEKLRNAFLAFR